MFLYARAAGQRSGLIPERFLRARLNAGNAIKELLGRSRKNKEDKEG